MPAIVFFQNACFQHKYIRSRDTSNIVERPERLRAVTAGISAAIARLEEVSLDTISKREIINSYDPDVLVSAMNQMKIEPASSPVIVIQSQATVNLLDNAAVKFIHGDIEKDEYLENLMSWAKNSKDKIMNEGTEIPREYNQGDLYLCPESINAVQGALGTVCEAVDKVMASSGDNVENPSKKAFVAIRPPGHHCGEDTPSGFCFVNNVAVGAAHAYLKHGIDRIVILDIDLHHGNGTQSIVWQINEETYRQALEQEAGAPVKRVGPRVYYGSIHDILSYPCEEQFWDVLYPQYYSKIIHKAKDFLDNTGGAGKDVIVFISCGMDACEHEYSSMSRHNKRVPASFYYRFARDAAAFSDKYARGRVVSVLEGGYSDRALMSGAMAHISGLSDVSQVDENWWSVENLEKLEKATKKRRGGRSSLPAPGSMDSWLERAVSIFTPLEGPAPAFSRSVAPIPRSDRSLRDRSKIKSASSSPSRKSTSATKAKRTVREENAGGTATDSLKAPQAYYESDGSSLTSLDSDHEPPVTKKLPRVILRVGKPPEATS
ncbi:histone deacetylase domain-containing protein [Cyathus striatus]|nr:histone deacetylase domain-containing protein [Cyathus striatus]